MPFARVSLYDSHAFQPATDNNAYVFESDLWPDVNTFQGKHRHQMFCAAKFASITPARFNRVRSSGNGACEKTEFPNVVTYNISKTQKEDQCVPNSPRVRFSESGVPGESAMVDFCCGAYEATLLKNTNAITTPFVNTAELLTHTPLSYETPFCLGQEDIEWLNEFNWSDPTPRTGSYEPCADPCWRETPATLPEW